jgi:hypothetical protein
VAGFLKFCKDTAKEAKAKREEAGKIRRKKRARDGDKTKVEELEREAEALMLALPEEEEGEAEEDEEEEAEEDDEVKKVVLPLFLKYGCSEEKITEPVIEAIVEYQKRVMLAGSADADCFLISDDQTHNNRCTLMSAIFTKGRHKKLGAICCAQRTTHLHPDARKNYNWAVCFGDKSEDNRNEFWKKFSINGDNRSCPEWNALVKRYLLDEHGQPIPGACFIIRGSADQGTSIENLVKDRCGDDADDIMEHFEEAHLGRDVWFYEVKMVEGPFKMGAPSLEQMPSSLFPESAQERVGQLASELAKAAWASPTKKTVRAFWAFATELHANCAEAVDSEMHEAMAHEWNVRNEPDSE